VTVCLLGQIKICERAHSQIRMCVCVRVHVRVRACVCIFAYTRADWDLRVEVCVFGHSRILK